MPFIQRSADWVIAKAWIEAKAKGVPPAVGTAKYQVLLSLVDTEQKNWEEELGGEWDSLYDSIDLGKISETNDYDLDESINHLSKRQGDYAYLLDSNNQKTPITIVRPDQLYRTQDRLTVAQLGRVLRFNKPFQADSSLIDQTFIVPAYLYTDDITTGDSLIQCSSPMFIAYMVAASYARNDLVKSGQYNNILDKAIALMDKMKSDNSGQIEEVPRQFIVAGEDWI